MTPVISPSSQAEVIAPSSSGRHSTTSRLMFVQSRTNHKRPRLHSILGAGASLTALSIHAIVPFSFHIQVRKCFTHLCSSETGPPQQGKRVFIGAHQLAGLYRIPRMLKVGVTLQNVSLSQ
jgi:hypothetical protein